MVPARVRLVDRKRLDDSGEVLQSGFWAAFKERFGWVAHPFIADYKDTSITLLVLSRVIAPGVRLAYVPLGPAFEEPDLGREELLTGIVQALERRLPSDTVCARFDLPWYREGAGNRPPALLESSRLRRSPVDVQPPSTVVLDLRRSEAELLAGMKSKWRYNIGLAERKGVVVVEDGGERLAEWYALHRETGERDRIAVHSYAYYRVLFDLAARYGEGAPEYRLLLAEHEGELLAGIVVAFRHGVAWYPYGASSNRGRNLMPNYALQWRGIQMARERGCLSYDFFGIPPEEDPSHPMHGLYRFKTGFGGTIRNRLGCYDVVLRPLRYTLQRQAEAARNFYYKRFRKR
jgi:lipid II:glycine glycyltransferase (peptidoglycan interpeptide bridge formation enzyme)